MSVTFSIKKSVCHVTSAHYRKDVRIFYKECKSLSDFGYKVTLIVNDNDPDEICEGVEIVSTKHKPKNRYERMVISRRKIKKLILKVNADVYHFHDPELLPIASWAKKQNKKVIFDFHEDLSQQILFKLWIPKIFRRLMSISYKQYEKSVVKKFDALITVTPKFIERLKKSNSNTFLITNYPIVREISNSNLPIRKSAICFAGGVTQQWNHENIIKAIEDIEDVEYILVGSGDEDYINKLRNLKGWNKVKYLGRLKHEEVRNIYNKSLIGMSLLSYNTQVGKDGTLGNTKIFEFMESGLPVICSNNILWKNIVRKFNCGIDVDPNNISEIREAIIFLLKNENKRIRYGKNARRAIITTYNWEIQEKELIKIYSRF